MAVGAPDMLYSPPVVDPADTALEQGLFQVELIYAYGTRAAHGQAGACVHAQCNVISDVT